MLRLLRTKQIAVLACFLSLATIAGAQTSIFSNPITGTNPNTANPYTTGQSVNAQLTVSGIGRGTGISGNNANNRYNANGFTTSTTTLDPNDYFEFTLTPATGYDIDFSSFDYTAQSSSSGPVSFSFRSSVDAFGSDIGSPTATGTTISLTGSAFQNITSPITFRIYGYGATLATGTFSINDFTFSGSVGAVALPIYLVSFDARSQAGSDRLSWSTSCGSTAAWFAVERSNGNEAFKPIATVNAQSSTCDGTHNYSFDAPAVAEGRSLYRLAMNDASGAITYSHTVSLTKGVTAAPADIRLSPVPAHNVLTVSGASAGCAWRIYDAQGRLVSSGVLNGSDIELGSLRGGLYFLSCAGASPIRFIKE